MLNNLKALVVIVVLALAIFHVVRPICLQFMSAEDFERRRNVWLALTMVAFVSPSFWMYAVVALLLLFWAAMKDENPLALYALVTFAIPNASFQLPSIVVNQLFDLTQYRILSLVIVLPAVMKSWRRPTFAGEAHLRATDILLIAFVVLQLVLFMPYEAVTNTMRRAFLFIIDSVVVLYAFSRLGSREKIGEIMVCFWLACMVMAPVALFEWARGWLLYTGLVETWGQTNRFAWLLRGESLRAQAATEHSINLGYVLSMGVGCYFYVRSRISQMWLRWFSIALLAAGIFVSGSRGAWLTAALLIVVFTMLRPDASRRLFRLAAGSFVAFGVMYVTPLKESVIDRLPFIGTSEQGTIEYRRQLFEASWVLIQQNPFFGDPFVYLRMEALRQGQGIIDIVNGYIFTALFSGIVGLALQISIFIFALWTGLKAVRRGPATSPDGSSVAACLLASISASMFYVATAGYSPIMYLLSGLLVSYAACMQRQPAEAKSDRGALVLGASRRPAEVR